MQELKKTAVQDTGPLVMRSNEIDLVELMYCLLDKIKFMLIAGLVLAAVMGLMNRPKAAPVYYTATSKLNLMGEAKRGEKLNDLSMYSQLVNDYREVFQNWQLHEQVREELGLDYSYSQMNGMVSVSNPSNTRILYITVKSGSAEEAAAMANAYAEAGRKYISEVLGRTEPSIFAEALVPTSPSSAAPEDKTARMAILGFILGVVLVAGFYTVRFITNDRILCAADIERYAGMPVLGEIPQGNKEGRK